MKKSIYLVLVIFTLLFANVLSAQARGHGHYSGSHVGVWVGPGWVAGWGPWWGVPAYPYYYNYWEPVVYQEESPVYVEPTPQAEEQTYWYFCPDSRNYYPYVKECPNGWMKVVPPTAPQDNGE